MSAAAGVDRRRGRYTRVCDWLDALLGGVALTALVLIVSSLAAQVFCRYVLTAPLRYSDGVAQAALTWLTFAGAAVLYREHGHIEIDLLAARLSTRAARLVASAVEVAVMAGLVLITTQIIETAPIMRRVTYGTLRLSAFVLHFVPLLVSSVATILFGAEALIRLWCHGSTRPEEGHL